MSEIICGISSIPFKCQHIPIRLIKREVNHPIFYVDQKRLLGLYSKYVKNHLTDIDSYLLFLALLKSTDSVIFTYPAIPTAQTPRIVASNIAQLTRVIWQTNAILTPSFKQPKFRITRETQDLSNVAMWIKSWEKNIVDFKAGIDSRAAEKRLQDAEDKLFKVIHSPESGNEKLAAAVADWANKAAEFPAHKREEWIKIIRKCYSLQSMFSVDKAVLYEIRDYCESNLEVGSVYYYHLMRTIRAGIINYNSFLGMGTSLDLDIAKDDPGYRILKNERELEEVRLAEIAEKAPEKEPRRLDYPNQLAFLRAKLAWRTAKNLTINIKKDEEDI